MCLGIPMRVLETDGLVARCAGRGEERRVNVMLIDAVPPGGWVLVHMERAVRALDEEEVGPLDAALDAILLAARGGDTDHLFADLLARPSEDGRGGE